MLESLKQTGLFRDRPDAELEALSSVVTQRRLNAGDTLFRVGQDGHTLFYLVEGRLRRIPGSQGRWTEGPQEQVILPNRLVGVGALNGGVYRATMVAETPCWLLEFDAKLLSRLSHPPTWLMQLMEELEFKTRFSDQILGWLRHTGLFRGLPPRELEKVMIRMTLEHFQAGTVVTRQGERASGMGLIVRGEARMVLDLSRTRRVEIAALTEGDLYGESGLLEENPREVTVEALTPLSVLTLDRDDIAALSDEAPYLLQVLRSRLDPDLTSKTGTMGPGVLLTGHARGLGRSSLAVQLAVSLEREGLSVALVDAVGPWQPFTLSRSLRLQGPLQRAASPAAARAGTSAASIERPGGEPLARGEGGWTAREAGTWRNIQLFELERPEGTHPEQVEQWLKGLKRRFGAVVVDGPSLHRSREAGIVGLVEACEWVLQVTESPETEQLPEAALSRDVLRVLPERTVVKVPYLGRDIVRMPWEPEVARSFVETGAPWIETHSGSRASQTVRRLKRAVLQQQVGLALSGGGNWGFSHIGVLQILQENHIPVDMLSGTSCGSFIGGLFASGMSGLDIEKTLIKDVIPGFIRHVSPSLFMRDGGLIKSQSFEHFLRDLFKGLELTELQLPFWANAMDAASGEEVVFRSGPLYRGVTAATALPGLFAPYSHGGRVLLDGGLINNLPLGLLYEMGCNISIGVNCIPHLNPGSLPEPPASLSHLLPARTRTSLRRGTLVPPLVGPLMAPLTAMSTLNMVMRGIQMLCHKVGEEAGRLADVYLQPDVGNAQWFEFHKVKDMISAGRVCAERQLDRLIDACPRDTR